ncbi:suppressor of lethality of KEX2 GAS1 double null mutant protein 1 [Yamadazyma tenuis]|uniref:Uncharacterized protein n=1 Tax=Candida tenuis (strain ATCC 10573 / BCRC 21748 / CBS 615 / JCM 9827 / NBRC 10315 / NRRL Y-1498 / VKM Y-70) TaxID=590646 RepID=G3B3X9_CANTC|nr:uncharacterized protein CANTEDRAFT_113914 [Yamadazyma tenuis ATCC 10573]EGV63888.1 hypothetical protein CANTEDRAFT_113914 [Yamadazyma tenuis ATCC 10573]WEJ96495.1 suppressor of lethality of KEX2 GAS1 double null mutant protein 1 [Yamadazyma tenuis]
MANSNSLAVGLAVGIPSFLILSLVLLLWIRNRRRQKVEDLNEQSIDLELQDNQSFNEFHEELHKPSQYPSVANGNQKTGEEVKVSDTSLNNFTNSGPPSDDMSGSSNGQKTGTTPTFSGSDHLDAVEEKFLDLGSGFPGHSKSNSAYDFYESFIPILPEDNVGSAPQHTNISPPTPKFKNVLHRSNDSMDKIIPNTNSSTSSIDRASYNLAKQLNNQNFFEKLPSRAGTIRPPTYPSNLNSNSHSNSSSDLVNKLIIHDGINDSYVYNGHKHVAGNNGENSADQSDGKPKKNGLSTILGDNFDNSFNNDNENELTGDVVFK